MIKTDRFTLYGVTAILLWSSLITLMRRVAEQLNPIGGAAMIYSISAVFLILILGMPKIKDFSLRYLLIGGGLFASYETFFSLALGFANDRLQTIEMGVINYLWPSLTVLFAIVLKKIATPRKREGEHQGTRSITWLIYPSICLAFFGVIWSILGKESLSLTAFSNNVASNPIAYCFALSGAIVWAIYCNVTKHLANGKNAITLFFILTAIVLWIEYGFSNEPAIPFSWASLLSLLTASAVMASGYALWNSAIIGGNMVFLATLSYFTPIFSTFLSALFLGVALSNTFWQGVIFVTLGSLMCWWVTREKSDKSHSVA